MTKELIKAIHEELTNAVNAVGERYNFKIANGSHITYSDTGFTYKAEVLYTTDENGDAIDPKQREFESLCEYYGLSAEDYHKEVRIHGDPVNLYKVAGINPKARKNSIRIMDVKSGKEYVCSPDALDNTDGTMLQKGYHRCKYCGNSVYGTDKDEPYMPVMR